MDFIRNIVKGIMVVGLMSFALVQDGLVWTAIPQSEIREMSGKVGDFYQRRTNFSVKVMHQTYKGHSSTMPYDQSEGFVRRKGEQFHSYMLGVHTYQDGQLHFVVDSIQKQVLVSDKKSFGPQDAIDLETAVAQEYVMSCRKATQDKKEVYRVDYKKGYKLSATELAVNSDHSLAWVTVYFREAIAESHKSDAAKVQPKARIVYSGYNLNPAFGDKEFSHTAYFTINGKKLVINNRYKHYQLLDNRISKNQTND